MARNEGGDYVTKEMYQKIMRGTDIIREEKQKAWIVTVIKGAKNFYDGFDVEDSLVAMEMLDKGEDFSTVQKYVQDLVASESFKESVNNLVLKFSSSGVEYYKETYKDCMSKKQRELVECIENQNKLMDERKAKKLEHWQEDEM